ncbi:hypothetical protein [Brevundimonas sp.]|uniref:hypothetical protein n=1 Tax=Brevundimonas sp. TaxID=1871086 RepID=UPI003F714D8F
MPLSDSLLVGGAHARTRFQQASSIRKRPETIAAALAFTCLIIGLGYAAFGLWTSLIFSSGFLGGFLLWLTVGGTVNYRSIRAPYWLTLALFAVHGSMKRSAASSQRFPASRASKRPPSPHGQLSV